MENSRFTYQYSAETSREVEDIRKKYLEREESELERLKRLDGKVRRAGKIQGICIGVIGCLIFGVGMCFGLDALAGADWLTVALCALGAVVMIPAYPVYRHISNKTRAALTPEILRLSEELLASGDKN